MNELFKQYIESLEPSFQRLIQMEPVTVANLPLEAPRAGIYLFSEAGQHLYVGRTNTIRKRLQNHCRLSPTTLLNSLLKVPAASYADVTDRRDGYESVSSKFVQASFQRQCVS